MPFFEIDGLPVGSDKPPIIIAEIGINHAGDIRIAKEMAKAAIDSGANIIKHQTHVIEDEMSFEAKLKIPGNDTRSIYEIMDSCALSEEHEFDLMQYVKSLGCIFLSTPFSRAAVDRLERFNVPAYKIGSGECNNYPLVEYIASKGKPVILSTGMNTLESISKAVKILETNSVPYALLHTTNSYPTPYEAVRVNCVSTLQNHFPNAVVGLSDHTLSNVPCVVSVALGGAIVERHFTDSMSRKGPDIPCSMDPEHLEILARDIQIAFQIRGNEKFMHPDEEITAKFAFSSVCTSTAIKSGEKFTHENIWVRRPAEGDFSPTDYQSLIGKVAASDIPANTQLKFSQVV